MSTISRIGRARISRARMSVLFSAAVASLAFVGAGHAKAAGVGDVFVIDLENHNWTQPNGNVAVIAGTTSTTGTAGSTIQQVYGNPAAPYINSLVTPGNPNAAQVSYSSTYYNVLSTAGNNNPDIHPSEPNYLWQEGGSNFGVLNDNDPYQTGNNVANIQTYLGANLERQRTESHWFDPGKAHLLEELSGRHGTLATHGHHGCERQSGGL